MLESQPPLTLNLQHVKRQTILSCKAGAKVRQLHQSNKFIDLFFGRKYKIKTKALIYKCVVKHKEETNREGTYINIHTRAREGERERKKKEGRAKQSTKIRR